jgi:hypothetical protein
MSADDRAVVPGQTYWYRLRVGSPASGATTFGPVEAAASAPRDFVLGAAWPNPSRSEIAIEFAVPRAAAVRLSVLDLAGREVAVLAAGARGPGRYVANWDGRDAHGAARTGVYFVRYATPAGRFSSRIAIVR